MTWNHSKELGRRFLSLFLVGGLGLTGCSFDVKNRVESWRLTSTLLPR
jgi:hypothetical protein